MTFQDTLNLHYEMMLKYRQAVGYSPYADKVYLPLFIRFCGENFADADSISKEMIDSWLATQSFKTKGTLANVLGILRHFTLFQNSIGFPAYVPDEDYAVHRNQYKPYIFSDDELQQFFTAIDSTPSTARCPDGMLIVPVLFRMMYCCGMRPGEPLRLRCSDIDLKNGDIYIKQSKRNKDRHIIMSEDLRCLCIKYDKLAGKREWFFQNSSGSPFSTAWMGRQFHKCWKRSGLIDKGNPRPYDLRHCFATRNIMNWVDTGKDIMGLLPYLSTYMGHSKFSHTLYYVHLLPERLRQSANIDWEQFDKIWRNTHEEN